MVYVFNSSGRVPQTTPLTFGQSQKPEKPEKPGKSAETQKPRQPSSDSAIVIAPSALAQTTPLAFSTAGKLLPQTGVAALLVATPALPIGAGPVDAEMRRRIAQKLRKHAGWVSRLPIFGNLCAQSADLDPDAVARWMFEQAIRYERSRTTDGQDGELCRCFHISRGSLGSAGLAWTWGDFLGALRPGPVDESCLQLVAQVAVPVSSLGASSRHRDTALTANRQLPQLQGKSSNLLKMLIPVLPMVYLGSETTHLQQAAAVRDLETNLSPVFNGSTATSDDTANRTPERAQKKKEFLAYAFRKFKGKYNETSDKFKPAAKEEIKKRRKEYWRQHDFTEDVETARGEPPLSREQIKEMDRFVEEKIKNLPAKETGQKATYNANHKTVAQTMVSTLALALQRIVETLAQSTDPSSGTNRSSSEFVNISVETLQNSKLTSEISQEASKPGHNTPAVANHPSSKEQNQPPKVTSIVPERKIKAELQNQDPTANNSAPGSGNNQTVIKNSRNDKAPEPEPVWWWPNVISVLLWLLSTYTPQRVVGYLQNHVWKQFFSPRKRQERLESLDTFKYKTKSVLYKKRKWNISSLKENDEWTGEKFQEKYQALEQEHQKQVTETLSNLLPHNFNGNVLERQIMIVGSHMKRVQQMKSKNFKDLDTLNLMLLEQFFNDLHPRPEAASFAEWVRTEFNCRHDIKRAGWNGKLLELLLRNWLTEEPGAVSNSIAAASSSLTDVPEPAVVQTFKSLKANETLGEALQPIFKILEDESQLAQLQADEKKTLQAVHITWTAGPEILQSSFDSNRLPKLTGDNVEWTPEKKRMMFTAVVQFLQKMLGESQGGRSANVRRGITVFAMLYATFPATVSAYDTSMDAFSAYSRDEAIGLNPSDLGRVFNMVTGKTALQNRNEQLSMEIQKLKQELQTQNQEYAKNVSEAQSRLQQTQSELEETTQSLQNAQKEGNQDTTKLQKEIEKHKSDSRKQREYVKKTSELHRKSQSALNEATQREQDLEKRSREKDKELQQTQQTIVQTNADIQQVQERLKTLKTKNQELTESKQLEIQSLQNQNAELLKKLVQLNQTYQEQAQIIDDPAQVQQSEKYIQMCINQTGAVLTDFLQKHNYTISKDGGPISKDVLENFVQSSFPALSEKARQLMSARINSSNFVYNQDTLNYWCQQTNPIHDEVLNSVPGIGEQEGVLRLLLRHDVLLLITLAILATLIAIDQRYQFWKWAKNDQVETDYSTINLPVLERTSELYRIFDTWANMPFSQNFKTRNKEDTVLSTERDQSFADVVRTGFKTFQSQWQTTNPLSAWRIEAPSEDFSAASRVFVNTSFQDLRSLFPVVTEYDSKSSAETKQEKNLKSLTSKDLKKADELFTESLNTLPSFTNQPKGNRGLLVDALTFVTGLKPKHYRSFCLVAMAIRGLKPGVQYYTDERKTEFSTVFNTNDYMPNTLGATFCFQCFHVLLSFMFFLDKVFPKPESLSQSTNPRNFVLWMQSEFLKRSTNDELDVQFQEWIQNQNPERNAVSRTSYSRHHPVQQKHALIGHGNSDNESDFPAPESAIVQSVPKEATKIELKECIGQLEAKLAEMAKRKTDIPTLKKIQSSLDSINNALNNHVTHNELSLQDALKNLHGLLSNKDYNDKDGSGPWKLDYPDDGVNAEEKPTNIWDQLLRIEELIKDQNQAKPSSSGGTTEEEVKRLTERSLELSKKMLALMEGMSKSLAGRSRRTSAFRSLHANTGAKDPFLAKLQAAFSRASCAVHFDFRCLPGVVENGDVHVFLESQRDRLPPALLARTLAHLAMRASSAKTGKQEQQTCLHILRLITREM